jgi:hypothetical protein
MNELIHILTLQNATFNGWAWAIGTVILLILIGMQWKEHRETSIRMIHLALFWPMAFAVLLIAGFIYTPIWIGRKIKDMGL